jgi:predicted AAA+ superfamily ATPase
MVKRRYWLERLTKAWESRKVVWLAGVRRVGKTVLCRTLPDVEYFDCELPRARLQMEDPQGFWDGLRGRRVVLDEVHRLHNPSELLKIAADHYPEIHLIATGSSSLGASTKFRDTLTGRKTDIWLTPMILPDLDDFQKPAMKHRMLHGGLPPFFLSDKLPELEFQEWIDAYWAKDIQELFRLERKSSFQKFIELVFTNSGGIFEATKYAAPCEVSRPTIANYLAVLEATYVAQVIRPYSTHRLSEIISAPKVYAFDTGFVCAFRGWDRLRNEDLGHLWEHLVLNELQARLGRQAVAYWRDKRGHEVDFVLVRRGKDPVAIECKWRADQFDAAGIQAFRRRYPEGANLLICNDVDRSFVKHIGDLEITVHSLRSLGDELAPSGSREKISH